MGYLPLADLPEAEYNAEKDVTKYPGAKAETYKLQARRVCHLLGHRTVISHVSVKVIFTKLYSR